MTLIGAPDGQRTVASAQLLLGTASTETQTVALPANTETISILVPGATNKLTVTVTGASTSMAYPVSDVANSPELYIASVYPGVDASVTVDIGTTGLGDWYIVADSSGRAVAVSSTPSGTPFKIQPPVLSDSQTRGTSYTLSIPKGNNAVGVLLITDETGLITGETVSDDGGGTWTEVVITGSQAAIYLGTNLSADAYTITIGCPNTAIQAALFQSFPDAVGTTSETTGHAFSGSTQSVSVGNDLTATAPSYLVAVAAWESSTGVPACAAPYATADLPNMSLMFNGNFVAGSPNTGSICGCFSIVKVDAGTYGWQVQLTLAASYSSGSATLVT